MAVCAPFNYSYYHVTAATVAAFEPCCMGADVSELWWQAIVSNGDYFAPPYRPDIEVNGTVYSLHDSLGTYVIDPACPTIATWHAVQRVGCVNVRIRVVGAYEVDHVTVHRSAGVIPISGYVMDYRHKFE